MTQGPPIPPQGLTTHPTDSTPIIDIELPKQPDSSKQTASASTPLQANDTSTTKDTTSPPSIHSDNEDMGSNTSYVTHPEMETDVDSSDCTSIKSNTATPEDNKKRPLDEQDSPSTPTYEVSQPNLPSLVVRLKKEKKRKHTTHKSPNKNL
jgi:hypothetical protein